MSTSITSPELSVGNPVFASSHLSTLSRDKGSLAAWRAAIGDHSDPVATLHDIRGDFAVGIREASGRVFLCVDRFAIQTLCYRVVDGTLRYAQRADQLADKDSEVDPQAIFNYLFFHSIPSPRTIYKDVHRLPPGHYALFEQGKLKIAPYWTPRFDEVQRADFTQLQQQFRQLLRESVTTQLDGSKPACFLSGGTDSSTVAGVIAEVAEQPVSSYSIGFDASGYDEMEYARIAAKKFRTDHHEYYVTPADLVKSIPEVARFYDQPFGNSSALPAYYCALMAKADGVTKILAGDGGDELFGGNSRYAMQRIFGLYGRVPGALRSAVMEPLLLRVPMARKLPLVRKAASYVEQARVPMPDRLNMYNLLIRLGIESILTPSFLAVIDTADPVKQQRPVWEQAHADNDLNRNLAFDWRYTLAENDLPKVVGTTALAGIAVGFPLLDQRLLDFSLRLPVDYKLRRLRLRWFFKEALRGFLPDEIITKQKHGFGLPFGVWASRDAGLKQLAVDSLNSLSQRGFVQPAFIKILIEKHLPEHPGYYGEMVWILMMLEQWLQVHAANYQFS